MLVLAGRSSDHNPLLILFSPPEANRWQRLTTFQVVVSWAMHADYRKIVKNTWKERSRLGNIWGVVQGKLRRCQQTLQRWVKKSVNLTEAVIKQKTKKLMDKQQ